MTAARPVIDPPATVAAPTPPAELAKPRRRASWPAVVAITAIAIGAGTLLGTQLRSPGSATPPPRPGSSAMPGMAVAAPARPPGVGSQATYVSPGRQQLVGVRTAAVGMQNIEDTIRTVGTLAYDETRTTQIHTRVSGWVEQLYVDYVGKSVRRGQPLFAVYSPDLATAQGEYLVALHARAQVTGGADKMAAADALLAASRERLRRWDVSDVQIAQLERAGHAPHTMTIVSPFDGVVLEKTAFAGQYVTPDMTSFRLGDLSTIWVMGQVFEYEASSLRIGDAVDVEFPYGQAAKLQARIDFIYPGVDPQTRRVMFRASLKNTARELKPDTYVTLVWHGETTKRLVVPKEAVIDTGARKYVLLALADGYFEPRDVQVGPSIGEFYPITGGVIDGARVVTSAQFLVDSETNLMAAMQGMSLTMPGMAAGSASAP